MLIQIQDLYNYITPRQVEQYLSMNPDAFTQAYNDAVGYITAQIGNIYDIPSMLEETESPDPTLTWMVRTMTAYNMSSPSMKQPEPLLFNVKQVYDTIKELRSGAYSFVGTPPQPTPNASGSVVSIMNKYKG